MTLTDMLAGGPGSGRYPKGFGHLIYKFGKKFFGKPDDLHESWDTSQHWRSRAYGGVLVNDKNEVLLRAPKNRYDGYHWTFAKGKMDHPLEHPKEVAQREVEQETGHASKIIKPIPGTFRSGSGATNNYYLMKSKGFDPMKMDNETYETRWVSQDKAKELLSRTTNRKGRDRDLQVLDAAFKAMKG